MSFLIEGETGEILAIIKAPKIMRMRVASVGAVGAKYLSKKNSRIAGVIGTGKVGRAQIEAISKIRNIEKIYAHSGRRKDKKYAHDIEKRLGIDIKAVEKIEDAVTNADILVTATNSTTPIIKGEYLNEGLHISAFGADCPLKIELDHTVFTKTDKIVIDSEQSLHTGELRVPIEEGVLSPNDIHGNIGEVVAGVIPGRENSTEITIFKNMGMTLPYVTINALLYEKALELNLGTEIEDRILDLIYS
jgi:ornithine cyclodeaminase/alanine dehydrogenase-like protein (mu-crystallin family)